MLQTLILDIRSPLLTSFFKIFPFFVSDIFYISIIAVGYWMSSYPRIFWHLGFLTPFSTLLNVILKNLFACPRPDASIHLISIKDSSHGFPSGDVQVAAMFWFILSYSFPSKPLRICSVILILCIMLSRIYLGVHSLDQVLGGLFFGLATVYVYLRPSVQRVFDDWQSSRLCSYWLICASCLLFYFMIALSISPLILIVIGILVGYGLSAPFVGKNIASPKARANLVLVFLSMISLVLIDRVFPKYSGNVIGSNDVIFIIKYAVIAFMIFVGLPWVQKQLIKRFSPVS